MFEDFNIYEGELDEFWNCPICGAYLPIVRGCVTYIPEVNPKHERVTKRVEDSVALPLVERNLFYIKRRLVKGATWRNISISLEGKEGLRLPARQMKDIYTILTGETPKNVFF